MVCTSFESTLFLRQLHVVAVQASLTWRLTNRGSFSGAGCVHPRVSGETEMYTAGSSWVPEKAGCSYTSGPRHVVGVWVESKAANSSDLLIVSKDTARLTKGYTTQAMPGTRCEVLHAYDSCRVKAHRDAQVSPHPTYRVCFGHTQHTT